MRPSPRPSALLLVLAVAFVLVLAGPGVARAWDMTPTDTSFDYTVHVGDNTVPAGILCPAMDSAGVCPAVAFTVAAAGSLTATATFPADQQIDVVVCQIQSPDIAVDNCPRGNEQPCTTTTAPNTDTSGLTVSQTQTVSCPAVTAGSFELLFVPVFVASCPQPGDPGFDPVNPCLSGPGVTVAGTIRFAPAGATTTPATPTGMVSAKVSGSGKVDVHSRFAIWARTKTADWDRRHADGRIQLRDDHACQFRSTTFTNVAINYNALTQGGDAHIDGTGYTKTAGTGWNQVSFHADAVDGGPNGQDSFKLTGTGCDNALVVLTAGKITIEPEHQHRDHPNRDDDDD